MSFSYQKCWRPLTGLMVLILLATALLETAWAQPATAIQTGRYLTVDSRVPKDQEDLLSPLVQIHFLSDIKTVGDAVHEVLRYSGYSLVETKQQSQDLQNTLQKPLPLVQRDLGPMPLRQSLTVLVGSAFHLMVDPLNRTVNFQLNTNFQLITD